MGVASENGDTVARCAVPYTNRLIIRRRQLNRVPRISETGPSVG